MRSYSSKIDSIATIVIDNLLLQKFLRAFFYFFASHRANISTCFYLVDISQPLFANFLSLLRQSTRANLLFGYPGSLQIHLPMIIYFRIELGYKSLTNVFILSKNFFSALINIKIINKKLYNDLEL